MMEDIVGGFLVMVGFFGLIGITALLLKLMAVSFIWAWALI
jgi:hypothetical protein